VRWRGRFPAGAVAGATVILILLAMAGQTVLLDEGGGSGPARSTGIPAAGRSSLPDYVGGAGSAAPSPVRNVVLILADDLDWKLWNEIPRLHALQQEGTTFTDYVVSDSLCCPSRTSLLRGQYVHNHLVVSNDVTSGGGWGTFRDDGYAKDCLPTWLHDAGVRTGLIGKYLNEFPSTIAEESSVQPGWDDFVVPISHANDYVGYDYRLDDNGTVTSYGHAPKDFLNDVLDAKAQDFLRTPGGPFFLELSSFTPHLPSPVAPRHLGSHAGAVAPRDASFNVAVTKAPSWLADLPRLGTRMIAHQDRVWVKRAESAESVADSVDAVRQALAETGHTDDTLVLVTSDNGFHVGSYRMHRGKRSAFDVDTVVPLVAIGPGIRPGAVVSDVVSETDLAPTITTALRAQAPDWVDGRSLWPLLDGTTASSGWRTGVVSESLGTVLPGDPDYQLIAPPSFAALRTRRWLYVEYINGERELYDRIADPAEIVNVASSAPSPVLEALHSQLQALRTCAGPSCRVADARPEA
jgi:arylsulfatase A-like enzyme